ncbi:MAG: rRNA pseudouridine synthase [Verrucomicrobia bacterium]|nr:MAG: rRNA pseudouridine synthase [Verrucomicrobiota bacterium]
MTNPETIRLQKIIAESGLASRREAEEWIKEGYVTVNGHTATLGQKADPLHDSIKVHGKLLPKKNFKKIALIMNKPRGVLCSHSDPYHDKTIFNYLPKNYQKLKLSYAGRLDKNSEGMLILTNDGQLAQNITHPKNKITKRYQVTLSKPFELKLIPKLLKGINLEGEHLYFTKIIPATIGDKKEYNVEVHLEQGRKREIRRLFEAFGYFVDRLKRFQIGNLTMKGLRVGETKELSPQELDLIFKK